MKKHQILVGFAAETQQLIIHAQDKLTRKNLDMIVANDITMPHAGFNVDTNIVKLLYPNHPMEELPKMSKDELGIVLDKILNIMSKKIDFLCKINYKFILVSFK